MAHYAVLNEDNIVVYVFVGKNEDELDADGNAVNWEIYYKAKRTSYNGNIRANYAGIGYTYNPEFDVFIAPQTYPSWKLNYTTFQWEAPIARPDEVEGFEFKWSEYNKEWVSVPLTTEN